MEVIKNQKYIHISPRKLRLVAGLIRKMTPAKALEILKFTPQVAGLHLAKAVKVALANTRQKGLDQDQVFFKKIEVNEGPRLKRMRPAPRGRVSPYKKRISHIKIVLSDEGSK